MKQVSPHRKRQANKGRVGTGVVVTSNYVGVANGVMWESDVCKPDKASALHGKKIDAILDERTLQRNRFNADFRVCITAPAVSLARFVVRLLHKQFPGAVDETGEIGGIISLKVEDADANKVLDFIQLCNLDRNTGGCGRLFTVAATFCGESRPGVVTTARRLHGRLN